MARALRLLIPGGWYHVSTRGNNRLAIFSDDDDRRRFLSLLSELPRRFTMEVHGYVLMDDHYHLVTRTGEANLNHAIRWLNVSYSVGYNRRHQRTGHLLHGRYRAEILESEREIPAVLRYLHLHPARKLHSPEPGPRPPGKYRMPPSIEIGLEHLPARLERLDSFEWSSWPALSGKIPPPGWLKDHAVLPGDLAGNQRSDRHRILREYTEVPLREGRIPVPWSNLIGGIVLGSPAFARALTFGPTVSTPLSTAKEVRVRIPWDSIVAGVCEIRGHPWETICHRYGEWGRDAAMHFAIHHGGHRLAEIVGAIPGLRYGAAAQALNRFSAKVGNSPEIQNFMQLLKTKLCVAP